MKNDSNLRNLYAGSGPSRPRMSREVLTPLLIAAGMVGLPVAIGISQCSSGEQDPPAPPPPAVNADTVYPNNYFLAGAGYYHAPYRTWFPLPFNSYDASRGWYRGGAWRRAAVEDADEQRAQQQSSGFAMRGGSSSGGGGAFARMQSSRPTPEAAQRANTGAAASHASPVMRGGFGLSSHPSIS